jgi:LysR family transcriptional regulator, mexEF-oprN operon transcriptional activator
MEPTARDQALFAHLAPALSTINQAVRGQIGFDPATSDRTIRFASPDDWEVVLIPHLLDRLAATAPHMQLVVRPADFRTVPDLLDHDQVDLALTATPPALERRYRQEVIHKEQFITLFDRQTTRLKLPLSMDSYLSVPHVFLSTRGDLRGQIDEVLAKMGRSRRILASVPRFSTIPFVLRSRPSLVNMPAASGRHYARLFDLKTADLPFAAPTFTVSLVWSTRADADPAVRWFKQLVTAAMTSLLKSKAQ